MIDVVFLVLTGLLVDPLWLIPAALVRVWLARRHTDEVLQRVTTHVAAGRIDDALKAARWLPGAVSSVILAGLESPDEAEAEVAMAAARQRELARHAVEPVLAAWVATFGLLAPQAYAVTRLAVAARSDAALSASDVRMWLILTAAGLTLAVLVTLGRFWLVARIRALAGDMEKGAAVVYNTTR